METRPYVEVVDNETGETRLIDADVCVVAMGPWSTRASQWFPDLEVPMTGVKSVSLVYDANDSVANEPAALFCAEDRNGCHLEVRLEQKEEEGDNHRKKKMKRNKI